MQVQDRADSRLSSWHQCSISIFAPAATETRIENSSHPAKLTAFLHLRIIKTFLLPLTSCIKSPLIAPGARPRPNMIMSKCLIPVPVFPRRARGGSGVRLRCGGRRISVTAEWPSRASSLRAYCRVTFT